jgi:hypothetical protein
MEPEAAPLGPAFIEFIGARWLEEVGVCIRCDEFMDMCAAEGALPMGADWC